MKLTFADKRVKEFGGVLRMENTNPGTRVEITIPSGSWLSSVPADVF